jgi:TetR/AcrR family transcriptional repressor of uid operon
VTVGLTEREHETRLGDQADRAVEALLSCVARQGVRKTTLDDVAREAGCSRATLYRYFASKQAVLDAALRSEAIRITAALAAAADAAVTIEDAVVALLVTAGAELGHHPALRFVATFEPEKVLPHLAFAGGDQFLAAATETLAPMLVPHVGAEQAPRAAEWITRVGLCLLFDPVPPVDLDDEPAVRAYAREFIVPAVAADPERSQRPTPTRR